ncbi:MAG: MBL fold metallo-hydrolase [Chloroflexi bacterium]|nr:MBL fold metallo-hydrolase [Chloroflexota bacterium]
MNVETLRAWLDRGQPVTVLDIRPASERAEWQIPGSMHVDAYAALKAHDPHALAGVELPADRTVVTVCGAGATSLIAARQLRERGLQAFSLAGGMKSWSLAWNSAEVSILGCEAQIVQVRRTGKGCLSYLIGSKEVATVIDAALEPEVYLDLAQHYGWTIKCVLDTHVHADHLSRSRKLVEQCGAALFLPDQQRVSYPFTAVRDGDVLATGPARLVALHTPGHTAESTCYLLDGKALFTGDTLFLAGVGRPDLEASPAEVQARAHMLYHSLQRLLTLPPETLILPGHTAEPVAFDGKALAKSLAEVRAQVKLLHLPEDIFVTTLLARIPPTPPNHHAIVKLNEAGLFPEGDPGYAKRSMELEVGANRCAVA